MLRRALRWVVARVVVVVVLLLLLLLLRVPISRQPFVLTSFVRCAVVSGTGPAQAAVVVQVEMAGLGCPSLA